MTPKGVATRKLNQTGKARVKVKVTFTPTGATAVARPVCVNLAKARQ